MEAKILIDPLSTHRSEFLSQLLNEITDPVHWRLINTYQTDDPVGSMENELGKILLEVLTHED